MVVGEFLRCRAADQPWNLSAVALGRPDSPLGAVPGLARKEHRRWWILLSARAPGDPPSQLGCRNEDDFYEGHGRCSVASVVPKLCH